MTENQNVSELLNIHDLAVAEFETIYSEGRTNKNYAKGKNWSEEKKRKILKDGHRQPYSMPLIAVKLNRLLSEQRNNRFDWKPRGRSQEDELPAEIGGYVLKYIDDNNLLKWVESEVYQDGLSGKYGVCGARIDTTKDVRGEIILEKIPFNEVCWDTNSKKYDLEDAEFFQRFYWTTRRKLYLEYPKLKAKIDKLPSDNTQSNVPVKDIKDWLQSDAKKDIVKIVNHYEKINKTVYVVKNLATPGQDPVIIESDVEKYIAKQTEFSPESFKVIKREKEYYHLTKFCFYDILEEKDLDYLPYCVYFCFFDDGDYWSIVDLARDPQLMYDRYLQMVDKMTSKNIRGNNYTLAMDLLHETEKKNLNKLTGDLVDGGKVVQVLTHSQGDVLRPIPHTNNIQVESEFIQIAQTLIEDIFGGRTFQGLNAEKKQTATESRILESQAKIGVFLYLDNLVRWKTNLGKLVWKMAGEVYTEDRQIRIMGESLSVKMKEIMTQNKTYTPSEIEPEAYGYLNLGQLPKSIQSTTVDIVIDKVEASATDRLAKFASLVSMNEYMIKAGYQPLPIEVILEYSNLDYTDKQKLIAYETEQKQMQQAQAEEASRRANVEAALNVMKETKPEPEPEQKEQIKARVNG